MNATALGSSNNGNADHQARIKLEARAFALGTTIHDPRVRNCHLSSRPGAGASSVHHRASRTGDWRPSMEMSDFEPATERTPMVGPAPAQDDEYIRFVQSLLDDSVSFSLLEDDEDEFQISDIDEDDDEDDDDDVDDNGPSLNDDSTPPLSSIPSSPIHVGTSAAAAMGNHAATISNGGTRQDHQSQDLADEVGSLMEEDLEAAVATLLTNHKHPTTVSVKAPSLVTHKQLYADGQHPPPVPTSVATTKKVTIASPASTASGSTTPAPATPLRDAARHCQQTPVTYSQAQQLRRLMARHYQLLVQQAILAIRAAQTQKDQSGQSESSDFQSGESAEDLAELLYGSVGMLQDLDQNRKDAIRNSIQLGTGCGNSDANMFDASGRRPSWHRDRHYQYNKPPPSRRSLLPSL